MQQKAEISASTVGIISFPLYLTLARHKQQIDVVRRGDEAQDPNPPVLIHYASVTPAPQPRASSEQ